MITLHHLNQSRSIRILWLLEEIGVPYVLKRYERRADNQLAPDELKDIHPLGKAPILEIDGQILAESGAMTEWLISRYAPHLAPKPDSDEYAQYLQWIHFAESSAMVPFLLSLFASKEPEKLSVIPPYAAIESNKILSYLNQHLENRSYLLGEKITGADFMMSFIIEALTARGQLAQYPNIERYGQRLAALPSWQRAWAIERDSSA
ncbi:glutathione S-transferase family protein [Suttonella ornithocola]|uniref:Glutathione S-transferase GST-6.0 n=1 Tax=Suttonella ornithocola TaxID=279832 RepID=A0A380MZZ1_9GAMM|nr:glutathione S-transferase [Suttonella ornithocola]SUO97794.1 Glutathione S-transferase GST-6.0 [Suttonella ornithocola]